MRSIFTLLIVLLAGTTLSAQIRFEKGTIVKNNGNREEVLIRNSNVFQDNNEIIYKYSNESELLSATPEDILEFSIGDDQLYHTSIVGIDKVKSNNKSLNTSDMPQLVEEKVFLQVLVEGEAVLYTYYKYKTQFFYSKGEEIKPLIYHKYLIEGNQIAENSMFKKQLYDDLKCDDNLSQRLRTVEYKLKDLVKVFVEYNNCKENTFTDYTASNTRADMNFTLRPGLNFSNFALTFANYAASSKQFSENTQIGLRIGVEAELIMPFKLNKWAVFAEPTFNSFESTDEFYGADVTVNFTTIEVPLGVRYYLFLNDESKFYLNGAIVPGISINSKVNFSIYPDVTIQNKPYVIGGLGYKFMDKYSAEFRMSSTRDIISDQEVRWLSEFNNFSLILGYTIF